MFLVLARHGETADNARRIFQGQAGSGLNRLGRAQAARLGERLRRSPPARIITSDLDRAVETSRIVAETCGGDIEIELDKRLREVDVGTWTGKGYDEVATLYPDEYAAWDSGIDVRRGGGETYSELAERIDGALRAIVLREREREAKDLGRPLLIVAHGGSIKSWVALKLLRVSGDGLRALGGVANTSMTVIETDRHGRFRLHGWNDIAHLEGLNADDHAD